MMLPRDLQLTVVTNAVPIAARLAGSPSVDLHLLPGRVRRPPTPPSARTPSRRSAGCAPTSPSSAPTASPAAHGLSTPDHAEAAAKRAMVDGAHRVVVLVDSSKIGQEHMVRFAEVADIDVVVTDAGIEDADRAELERPTSRSSSHDRDTTGLIVTLTPNPSIDRTVALTGDLDRGARAASRVGDLAGGRQGREHLPRRARRGRADDRRAPRLKDDPFVVELLRDGIDCRPEQPAGAVRVNLTLTEPDGTTTKVNSPGAVVGPADLDRLATAVTQRARQAALGGARRVAAAGRAGHVVRRAGRRPAPAATARVAVDTSGAPLGALAAGLEQHAPDLMKPNGEELASLTGGDADGDRGRPGRRRRRGRRARRARRRRRARHARRLRRGAGHRRGRLARHASPDHRRQHRRCRRLQPVRLPARRPARRRARRAAASRRGLRQRRRRPCPVRRSPPRRTSVPTSSRSASSTRRHSPAATQRTEAMTDHDHVDDHARARPPRRRPRRRQDRGDPSARRTSSPTPAAPPNPDGLADDALAREATSATGLPGGIAIPHCRTEHVDVPTLAFARLSPGTDFGAKDGPADLAFLIAAPAGGDATHLKLLTQLARALVKKEFTDGLRARRPRARSSGWSTTWSARPRRPGRQGPGCRRGLALPRLPRRPPPAEPAPAAPPARRSLVAVTACPTGIAHTYMAAEALEAAAARAGVDIAVETQGSAGSTPLPRDDHRQRRRRDLRRRRRGARPLPVRRQAARRVRGEAGHRRRGRA